MSEKLSARDRADIQKIAQVVLGCFMTKGTPYEINPETVLTDLNKANVDVKTRIFLGMVQNALKGDLKAAEFVFKYAGWEPVKENHVTMDLPQIIDDMGSKKEETVKQAVDSVIL